jgi:hypothetical protein
MRGLMTRMRLTGRPMRGGHLGAGADHQPPVLVPIGDADVGLDVRLLLLRRTVFPFKDVVGLGPLDLSVAALGIDVMDDVALGVVDALCVRFIVDDGRAVLHRLHGI